MTPFQKVLHKLGYDLDEDWDPEVEAVARRAARVLGRERVCWIASADEHFDLDGDTRAIFGMTEDPVILAAYGWHEGRHVTVFTPKLHTDEMRAAHTWYCLRTIAFTHREAVEYERRRRRRQ